VISGNMDKKLAMGALSALGHEQRLDIFRLLMRAEPTGLFAGQVAQSLNAPANTVSSNLAILSQAGLIESEREGRSIRYRAKVQSMQELLSFLTDDCCGGHPSLCLDQSVSKACCGE
jgi:ArsR family transcriptional regulator